MGLFSYYTASGQMHISDSTYILFIYTIKCDISIPKAWSMSEDYLKDLPLRFWIEYKPAG